MNAKKHEVGFQHEWLILYGLQITARDPKTSEVVSIKCRFCEFGRDYAENEERKRKKTNHVKFYNKPWRSDNMKRHVIEQHQNRYADYSKLCGAAKKRLFKEFKDA
jgi:hypothetical protein